MATLFSIASVGNAATSANWNIDYTPGAPSSVSNQSYTAYIAYNSDGFVAHCSSITGGQGRQVSITSSSAGGINGGTIYITSTGNTPRFYFNGSSVNDVAIKFKARVAIRCKAHGTVHH